jgi:hypothetical protein
MSSSLVVNWPIVKLKILHWANTELEGSVEHWSTIVFAKMQNGREPCLIQGTSSIVAADVGFNIEEHKKIVNRSQSGVELYIAA